MRNLAVIALIGVLICAFVLDSEAGVIDDDPYGRIVNGKAVTTKKPTKKVTTKKAVTKKEIATEPLSVMSIPVDQGKNGRPPVFMEQ